MDTNLIMQLREMTGAGILDAKKALEETGGDIGKAADELRKKGIAKAASKSERATNEGRVHSYIHGNGRVGTLVEVLCETDFVARTEQFQQFVHDIAMQVAASNPLYVSPNQVPAEVIEKEREIAIAEIGAGKSAEIMDKIIAGKIEKYYSEVCLLRQPFIKDEDQTIEEYLKATIAKLGENIQIRRFCRFSLGE
ncbi:elongation factor Ts [Candidatus Uhrbacteria bacterium RIFCSPHIGHO2_12_FULL_57_11]|uniref:Elongation factor Ts n=2 Tax=Candidatus Uhriibacteriota TaxID=1752732 RepID=A0A1F7UH12_9BACT|nr:MAG: elongation factor Ts [Candidatus Uhrbacteria bacterium RIFCSPHIGHO2_02_FULL_57_19]OGL77571.1 MAG: elongation factor Ts [Candidatus Uhrbacteria bacterium RIFCSPHIGHO2_12_FULL_57_11]